jgi:methylglutaconyl-CoA hydratase
VARITLMRADRHNAFDDLLIARLTELLEDVAATAEIRVLVLAAAGKSFCAGADLDWMRRCAGYSPAENAADARRLGRLMACLDGLKNPPWRWSRGRPMAAGSGWSRPATWRWRRKTPGSACPRSGSG